MPRIECVYVIAEDASEKLKMFISNIFLHTESNIREGSQRQTVEHTLENNIFKNKNYRNVLEH